MVDSLSSSDDADFSDSGFRLLGLHSVSQPDPSFIRLIVHPHFFMLAFSLLFKKL